MQTCSTHHDDHQQFRRLLAEPEGVDVVFGWVLKTGIKCPADKATGLYFLAHQNELLDKLGFDAGSDQYDVHLIMFTACNQGEFSATVAELELRLGRQLVTIPVRQKPEDVAVAN